MDYAFAWSINISIWPVEWVSIRIWIGNHSYEWHLRHPLQMEYQYGVYGERQIKSLFRRGKHA